MDTIAHYSTRIVITAIAAITVCSTLLPLTGCSVWEDRPRLRKQEISMNEPTDQVPPIMLDALNGHHMLIMQSPNSGWMFKIDRDERIADGTRVFITVRRPDPALMYPQAIVEKNLLSDIPSKINIEIYARILDAHEKAEKQGYGLLRTVDHFED